MVVNKYIPYSGKYEVYIARIEQKTIVEITKISVVGKGFSSDLEKIVSNSQIPSPERKSPIVYLANVIYGPGFIDDYVKKSHEQVTKEVDDLPADEFSAVLGMYDPNTDTVYVLSGLAPHVKKFVLEHEYVHRERHFKGLSQDEASVDSEAQSRLGYNPIPRTYRDAA